MLKDLIKLANHLDSKGLTKEADFLDRIIKKSSDDEIYSKLLRHCMSDDDESIDEFEECLENFVKKCNPDIDRFGISHIMRNMFEHKERLKEHVTSSDKSDIEAVKEFMADIESMAKRF
jgi:hypothetical protein